MPIDPKRQLILMLCCLIFGYAAGFFYDLLRALRYSIRSKLVTAVCDILFCIILFLSLFLIGYTAGDGVQRLYAPAFSLMSMGLYFLGISQFVLPFFRKTLSTIASALRLILSPLRFIIKKTKKMLIFLKNSFYSKKKCYTMECSSENVPKNGIHRHPPPQKGTEDEAEKGRYYY